MPQQQLGLSGSGVLGILENWAIAEVRSSIVAVASCRLLVRGDSGVRGREASRLSVVVVVMMLDWESCGCSGWVGY